MMESPAKQKIVDPEAIKSLDPARRAFAEELIRNGEWKLRKEAAEV